MRLKVMRLKEIGGVRATLLRNLGSWTRKDKPASPQEIIHRNLEGPNHEEPDPLAHGDLVRGLAWSWHFARPGANRGEPAKGAAAAHPPGCA
jgi:hypothetical protein